MADQERLDMLKQGVESWNTWRSENPNLQPDLSKADLRATDISTTKFEEDPNMVGFTWWTTLDAKITDAEFQAISTKTAHNQKTTKQNTDQPTVATTIYLNLKGANLSRANLSGKDLRNVDFTETDLKGANLTGANLNGANLSQTNLSGADFTDANLTDANLTSANLSRTNFDSTKLQDADLTGANVKEAKIRKADLRRVNLSEANLCAKELTGANLSGANLSGANLSGANLSGANLSGANLSGANLKWATLTGANLQGADLQQANLCEADLQRANLSEANLCGANLSGCHIYAISAWNVRLEETIQTNLIITRYKEPTITVDNIEVAQFIYLLLNNERIRDLIDNITSKVVLILGRFTPKQKLVLDVLRGELRNQNYTPVIFDFEKPATRDLTETVITLAHLARFIIVDLTDPSSAPHEVAMVIPHTVVPVQPLLSQEPLLIDGKSVERREYAMFEDLRRRYHWVLPTLRYQDKDELLALLQTKVIAPAEQKAKELMQPK